jgi:mannopine transport system permease protein
MSSATGKSFDLKASLTLVLPVAAMLAVFFVVPLSTLVEQSLFKPEFGFSNYTKVLTSDLYLTILLRTLRLSVFVTLLTLLLGYPVALTMARVSNRMAFLMAIGVMLPLWTAVLVRSYAWIVLLQRKGLVNEFLMNTGIISQPLRMLYTEGAVILATTHVLLPFMILSIYSVIRSIPKDLTLASANLGAGGMETFRLVTLPLSMPGVYSGVLMVFIISLGFYITPALLGGPETLMMSTLIGQQTTETLDWGLAGALSVILLIITLMLVALFGRVLRLEAKGG